MFNIRAKSISQQVGAPLRPDFQRSVAAQVGSGRALALRSARSGYITERAAGKRCQEKGVRNRFPPSMDPLVSRLPENGS
jgi:hypothetical protein